MDSRPGRARADLWKDLDEKDIFYPVIGWADCVLGFCAREEK
jgi:hypothetical protein